ncbi:MAG: murein tripeptide amidase MpaA [Planctomycetes bacterium]|nr:murein tripeptide amidase MpaA [Planctomycetota bacterium]
MPHRPRSERGVVALEPELYGRSHLGAPLEVFRPAGECRVLIFGGIHGDEPESTATLSWALRHLAAPPPHCAVVLAANPDGLLRGTRANARGVDLNRNWPAQNWSAAPVRHRVFSEDPRDIELSTGDAPGSEPETRALLALIGELRPEIVVAVHAPLACVEDPAASALGRWLAERSELPLVDSVGYVTPGSFGSWAPEQGCRVITYELPVAALEQQLRRFAPVFLELMLGSEAADAADRAPWS